MSDSISPQEAPSSNQLEPRHLDFVFNGSGGEYFKIWIVNVVLSIVTLGIYSAWAKVRTKRYFYGNTELDGHNFEYLANPLNILKGRLIAAAILAIYIFAQDFYPAISIAIALLIGLLAPWLFIRAYAFNAYNSSYRGIRFRFTAKWSEAAKIFLLWPIVVLLTFGLLTPYLYFRKERLLLEGHAYGKENFQYSATVGDFYLLALKLIAVSLVAGVALVVFMGAAAFISAGDPNLMMLSQLIIMMPFYLLLMAIATVLFFNLRYNNLALGENTFAGNYQLGSWTWMLIKNTLLTVLTLGIYYPWAQINVARYRLSHMSLTAVDLDHFTADAKQQVSAAGEEIGEAFDLGFGI